MKIEANTVQDYLNALPVERRDAFNKLRQVILRSKPEELEETLSYGMIGYVVPHSVYPAGYHCDPKLPLPFINIASQKNYIALYHSGIYADKNLHDWFVGEYPKHTDAKLDMGKSCVRFKKMDKIPFALIEELMGKLSVQEWIGIYENAVKRK
ncbi:DUF1801 domain-containing protein [Galbibacter mesophilus]|uniref:DUF1801 domain-containing protein n=1 Tax=Galbibacter mesophilus TaxID=379069 RepID=UPI00191D11EE|nr:DUF1801 domain-containing protein [Galbibacter mesophilus]MCM5664250.1 DUF1801 domain-containing protein [Galbibacter mesophilus]